jgi:hypothetical protein
LDQHLFYDQGNHVTDEAEVLRSAIANRTAATFDERCTALAVIINLANFAEDPWVGAAAIRHLQEVEGIAVISDRPHTPILATSNGVHIEHQAAVR